MMGQPLSCARLPNQCILIAWGAGALGFLVGCGTSARGGPPGEHDSGMRPDDAAASTDGDARPIDAGAAGDSESVSSGSDADSCSAERSDSSPPPKCGCTATRIVNYMHNMPDGGGFGTVQVPDIAVSSTDLYYLLSGVPIRGSLTDTWDGYLMRVDIRGGNAVPIAYVPGGGSHMSQGLAVTPTAVVFSAARADDAGAGAILSVALDGSDAGWLATSYGLDNATLVADQETVYFSGALQPDAGPVVQSVSLSGGPAQPLAVPPGSYTFGIGTDAVYFANAGAGTVYSFFPDGGQISELTTGQAEPFYPVACGPGPDVCWLNVGHPSLAADLVQLAPGGTPVVLAQGVVSAPLAFVFDGKNFFVTGGSGGLSLGRVAADGGAPGVVQIGFGISSLALDDECLYWADRDSIWSLARSAADVAGIGDQ